MTTTFIIAEAGVNHNGREDLAFELVDAAAESGADAVKFQTFSADKLVRKGAATAEYQERQTGSTDQHNLLKALELSRDLHVALFERCEMLGIEFMSTPFDEEAASFLADLGMQRFKIPSGEITNEPFLAHIAAIGRPIILSTGMADLAEIERAVTVIRETRTRVGLPALVTGDLTVLHCTSNYPANYADTNLRAMATIAAATGLPVGYSDHTLGLAVSTAAVALGATVIEKHYTLDKTMSGPDHAASLTISELRELVKQIRAVEAALGSPEKRPTQSELPVRALVRRSITLIRPVQAGAAITREDIALLRPGDGIAPGAWDDVIGRRATRAMDTGTTLRWSDVK
ncbi:N-acetylneuraminate synthase [Sphingomonas sp. C3-2]|uniref:N-acetylneuraminate synthase n=1 Tax=Sphingomonas sp. C3-2 TaxID=3062169 RepID=UPI00294AFC68|nr:N-acetylneuraminate synthase [Sphingomonas sp. C3-2]WOK35107.1 N-acetylneuraminate synthase [Sphingomonas sp. C3-2]